MAVEIVRGQLKGTEFISGLTTLKLMVSMVAVSVNRLLGTPGTHAWPSLGISSLVC